MLVRCNSCRRTLKKDEIRREQVWSKREGKAKDINLCKYCGSSVKPKNGKK